MTTKSKAIAAISLGAVIATGAVAADDSAALREILARQLPATRVDGVQATPVAGVYEVTMGKNVAYVDASGRYFMFGHLYDMVAQQDLTSARKPAVDQIDFAKLPFDDAIKFVYGNGRRKIAIFSDPDCPFCRQLEPELAQLTDATVYVFAAPYPSLHPEAVNKSISIWCSTDRAKAWKTYANTGLLTRANGVCDNPIERNMALRDRLGIMGTPTIITADGQKRPGRASIAELNQWLVATR